MTGCFVSSCLSTLTLFTTVCPSHVGLKQRLYCIISSLNLKRIAVRNRCQRFLCNISTFSWQCTSYSRKHQGQRGSRVPRRWVHSYICMTWTSATRLTFTSWRKMEDNVLYSCRVTVSRRVIITIDWFCQQTSTLFSCLLLCVCQKKRLNLHYDHVTMRTSLVPINSVDQVIKMKLNWIAGDDIGSVNHLLLIFTFFRLRFLTHPLIQASTRRQLDWSRQMGGGHVPKKSNERRGLLVLF